jgi:hypothetical protein
MQSLLETQKKQGFKSKKQITKERIQTFSKLT